MKERKVCVAVPTYNRKELLVECLECILAQTYPVEAIVLIDNVSTDGTHEFLEQKGLLANPKIEYVRLPPPNVGSAGAYYEGIKRARDKDVDFVWIMDDDTFPKESCLEKLLEANEIVEAAGEKASYFASSVYTITGKPSNFATVDTLPDETGRRHCWYKYLDKGLVGISSSTSVSILIRKEAIVRCGNYFRYYFMWGDDTEYTMRLYKYWGAAYLVGASVATHRKDDGSTSIYDEKDKVRLKNRYYNSRNAAINGRKYRNANPLNQFFRKCFRCIWLLGKPNGLYLASRIMKGFIASLICYKKFSRLIDQEIEEGKKAWEEQYGSKTQGGTC